jgi:hypothetical protein
MYRFHNYCSVSSETSLENMDIPFLLQISDSGARVNTQTETVEDAIMGVRRTVIEGQFSS